MLDPDKSKEVLTRELALLREENKSYHDLLKILDIGIVVHAPDTSVIQSNPKAKGMFGLSGKHTDDQHINYLNCTFLDETGSPVEPGEIPVNWIIKNQIPLKNRVFGIALPGQDEISHIMVNGYPVLNADGNIEEIIVCCAGITEGRLIAEALRVSEEKYSEIFFTSPYAISITHPKSGLITEVNNAFLSISGYSRDEVINDSTFALNLWVNIEERNSVISSLLEGKAVRGMECLFRRKNGDIMVGLISAHIVKVKGEPLILSSINDITASKEAEKALAESEALYRSILHASPDNISVSDMEGHILMTSASAIKMFGYGESHEVIGRSFLEFLDPGDYSNAMAYLEQLHSDIIPGPGEFKGLKKDGTIFDIEVNAEFIRNADRQPSKMLFIIRDISTRKQMEMRLIQSEKRFREVVEQSREMVWEVDATGLFTYASPLSMQIYGYMPEELIGIFHFFDLVPEPDRSQMMMNVKEIFLKKGDVHDYNSRIVRKDGSEGVVLTNGVPIIDESGVLIGYRGINSDITKRKRAEEALQKLNEELEQRVKERTGQLLEANVELESFAHSISHDLRAPLRNLNGFIGLLKEINADRSEDELRYLDFMTNSAQEMSLLIDAILSFSKLNRTEMKKTIVRMPVIVDEAIKFFEQELQNRTVSISAGHLPDAECDEQLIRQVWINLLSNAIKYTGRKTEAVIEIGSIDKEKEIVYYIRDNGAGFNSKYASRLFGVFQRLHRPTEFEGVGIGLANVNRIVTRHGGYCYAEGEVDKGATFCFTLPKS